MEDFDWESFKKGKFIVNCITEKQARKFLKECRKHNIFWKSEGIFFFTFWSVFKSETCYYYSIEKGLVYNTKDFFEKLVCYKF